MRVSPQPLQTDDLVLTGCVGPHGRVHPRAGPAAAGDAGGHAAHHALGSHHVGGEAVDGGARVHRGDGRAVVRVLAGAEEGELLPEAATRQAVEEEVHRVVDVHQLVADGLGDRVGGGVLAAPVRPADQQDDARRDADEEAEGGAETHGRHLDERLVLVPPARLARQPQPLHVHQHLDDPHVAEEQRGERQSADESEHDPGPHERLVALVGGRRPAARAQQHRAVVVEHVLRAACPEHVRVLGGGDDERERAVELGAPVETHLLLAEREGDGDEAVDGEHDEDPDGRVARRVEEELLQLAGERVELLEDEQARRLQPLGDDAGHQHAQVADRHQTQVDARGGAAHAPSAHHQQDERVSDESDEQDQRCRIGPQVALHRPPPVARRRR